MRSIVDLIRGSNPYALAFMFISLSLHGQEIGPEDPSFAVIMQSLMPGDELVLRGGTYDLANRRLAINLNGTAEQPIIIRAKDGESPIIVQPTNQQNIMDILSASHLVIKGLEFQGGSAGIRLYSASHFTLEECKIHGTEYAAVTANNPGQTYEGLKLLRNEMSGAGTAVPEAIYFGCNNDGCRVKNSVIEGNYIHNWIGSRSSSAIELKLGSYGNVIRDNVIHDTMNAIGVMSTAGNGPQNIVEGNILWSSESGSGMEVGADAIVRNNIVLGRVTFSPRQLATTSNIEFVNNTVIGVDGVAVKVSSFATAPISIANNAIYANNAGYALDLINVDGNAVQLSGNVGEGALRNVNSGFTVGGGLASDMIAADYSGVPPINPFPAPGGALVGTGDANYITEKDFNNNSRNGAADVGAYKFSPGGNPGWIISNGFKVRPNTFADVPTDYWAYSFIEALAGAGITSGCGNGNYCPEGPVTRAQMAVFLERGMNGSSFNPPPATGNVFRDVGAGDFAAAWIEQLANDGITAGCGNGNFCPNAEITRAQMAVFLLRAKYGAAHSPPTATGLFADVPLSHWAVHWIEQLAAEGITVGCGNGNYCPAGTVTRAQMAVFLVRTYGL